MTPLITLFSAILIGYLLRRQRVPSVPSGVVSVVVWVLLLLMGIAIGGNRAIVENLGSYGSKALAVGGLATLGSVVAAYFLNRIISRRRS